MKKTRKRALYVLAALFAALFVLSCLAGFSACGGDGDEATVSSVSISGSKSEMTVGEDVALTASVTMSDGSAYSGSYSWSTSDSSVVSLSATDTASVTATANAEGDATITLTVDNDKSATCKITVAEATTEPTEVSTADELTAAIALGGDIELTDDITASNGFTVSADTELDLGVYSIICSADDTITVSEGVALTVTGSGTVDATANGKAALVNEGGTVILSGGTFERSKETGTSDTDNGGNSYYTVVNHGTMTINEGVSILNAGDYSSNLENGWYDGGDDTKSATMTINGGTICGGLYAVKNDSCGILTVNGGTIGGARSDTDTMPYRALLNWNEATLNGGKLLGGNSGEYYEENGSTGYGDGSVIYNTASTNSFECGKLTIGDEDGNGPEIIYEVSSTDQSKARYAEGVYLDSGEVTVAGGSIGFDIDEGEESYCYCIGVWVIEGTLTVSGGTISGDETIEVYGDPYTGTATITGGTFEGDIVAYALADQTGTSPLTLDERVANDFTLVMYSDYYGGTTTDNASNDAFVFVYTQNVAA